MATYAFKAIDLAGIPQNGTIEGADKKSVTSELSAKGAVLNPDVIGRCSGPAPAFTAQRYTP